MYYSDKLVQVHYLALLMVNLMSRTNHNNKQIYILPAAPRSLLNVEVTISPVTYLNTTTTTVGMTTN